MADATTTINAPTVPGGDKLDESLITQSDGVTQAKRPRVAIGDDKGRLYDACNPMPVQDVAARRAAELAAMADRMQMATNLATRSRERITWGDRGRDPFGRGAR